MNRHGPKNCHAQIFQFIQAGRHARQISRRGKIPGKNFVNHPVAQPLRRGSGRDFGKVLPRYSLRAEQCRHCQRADDDFRTAIDIHKT